MALASFRALVSQIGALALFLRASTRTPAWASLRMEDVAFHVVRLGNHSVAIAAQVAIFAGLVLALQFAHFLSRMGVEYTVGRVVMVSLLREMGPVLTALSVGARIASGMTAELGAMKVSEQIDAMRALGVDPFSRLVTPRLVASTLVLPVLTAVADALALLSAAVVVKAEYGIPLREFLFSAFDAAEVSDFLTGLGKSAVFGSLIACVACFRGFEVMAGSEGVGRATTSTVSLCAVGVLLADFLLTRMFLGV